MKKTWLNGYASEFSVDYDPILGNIKKSMSIVHGNFMFKYDIK